MGTKIFKKDVKTNWIVILFVSIVFIMIITYLGIQSKNEVQQIATDQFTEQQLLLAKQVSSGMKEFLNEKTVTFEVLAEHMSHATPDMIETYFKNIYNESSDIYVLEFLNESGVVTVGHPAEYTPYGYDLYHYNRSEDKEGEKLLITTFENVRDNKETRITRPITLIEGGLGAFIWVPVFDEDKFKGVVLVIIRISDISDRFLNIYDPSKHIYLIDEQGTILFCNFGEHIVGDNYLNSFDPDTLQHQILLDQMKGKEGKGSYYLDDNSDKKLVAYSPIPWRNVNLSIGVISSESEVKDIITSVFRKQSMFVGISGGFISISGLLIILFLLRWNKSLEIEVNKKTGEIKESNRLLQKVNKELTELDKLKSDFLSMVSHELRTPLTALKTSSELLLEDNVKPETRKKLAEMMTRNTDRLTRIVSDLLEYSKIESGGIDYKKEMVDLHEIIDIVVESIRTQYENKGLNLTMSLPEKLSSICADKKRIFQVFLNLLNNSLKFTPKGGNVEIMGFEFEDHIEIHVKDDGKGIPKDKLENIFTKFYQIDNTSSQYYGGIGLGLSISKNILDEHGASIEVKSDVGKGCDFILKFYK